MKTAVCPECGEEYRLQRGAIKEQDGNVFAPVTCTECGYEFEWEDKNVDRREQTDD